MGRPLRTIPVAALGLTFTTGCQLGGGLRATWDAVEITQDGDDITENYLYSRTYGGCRTDRAVAMVIGPDLIGGFFRTYAIDCEGTERDRESGYGTYIDADRNQGRWLIRMGSNAEFDCELSVRLKCSLDLVYDYYGTRPLQRWEFARR